MEKILIIEDDKKIATLLQDYLKKYNLNAHITTNFDDIMPLFNELSPHLVLLDINLPKYDGYFWCRKIREVSVCPIIFISARDGELDQIMALENGADDYITKPFSYQVVIAKVRAQLRRVYGDFANPYQEPEFHEGSLSFYPLKFTIERAGKAIELSKNEAKLLEVMWRSAPNVANRDLLYEEIWDEISFIDDNTLSVNVTRLRKKLLDLGVKDSIKSVRGYGYQWVYKEES
ncbi:response regulator transcription factor [Listeria weihenstephanensis]|uniref:Response regulator transcription factor n=1 Tax=Listeria weihenstephanensis TaxID=1006155 RepID=A0A841Z2K0_9LIST|nr:response regulator transcription factor [Listeria weihenstephanensis]MBC1499445.1 response regulator transcription factor [Listeria weihenstephanensis]